MWPAWGGYLRLIEWRKLSFDQVPDPAAGGGPSGNSSITFKVLEVAKSGGKNTEVHFRKPSAHFVKVQGPLAPTLGGGGGKSRLTD